MNRIANLSEAFQKQEKRHMKRLSFITQFKIEFLLRLTGCREVLGKMPANIKISICFFAGNTDYAIFGNFLNTFMPTADVKSTIFKNYLKLLQTN